MLAEIFMVRLETAVRVAQETIPASNSRFVAFYQTGLPERIKGHADKSVATLQVPNRDT
jgi:hypothetical protein